MKTYGSKVCLIRPCTCCRSEAKGEKLVANKSRERREGKKQIDRELQYENGRRKKSIR